MSHRIALGTLVFVLALSPLDAAAQKARRAPLATPAPTAVAAPAAVPAPATIPAPSTPAEIARAAGRKLDAFQAQEARAALEPLVPQAASNADVAIAYGRLLEQERKYDESTSVLQKAAVAAPSDPRVPLWLGETFLRQRKTAEADAAFRKAEELAASAVVSSPSNVDALVVRGAALSRLRRFDEAIVVLGRARELDGARAETLYQMGATRAFQQQWSEAVTLLTETVAKDTGRAMAYYYRGLAYDKLGRKDLMVLDLDRFVKLAPGAPEAERARAVLAGASR
jgi:tetratricopeptide (TPR) repeat protein